jgi:hypothetical protein
MNMKTNEVPEMNPHELLVQQLAERLVKMGWLTANSAGMRQMMENLRNGADDQLRGLIAACERRIANPSR